MAYLSAAQILDLLRDYLARSLLTGSLQLDRSQSDGRLNSQSNERQISYIFE